MTVTGKMLPLQKVARLLDVSEKTIKRLVDRGELIAYKIGRQYRFEWDDVKAYIKRQEVV